MNTPQDQLFTAVGSLTDEPRSGTGLAPNNEGSNGVWHMEAGPFQRPALSSTQSKEAIVPRLQALYPQPCLRVCVCVYVHAVHVDFFNEIGFPHPPTNENVSFRKKC